MAGSSKRFTFAAVVLPFLFLVMSGSARAIPPNVITVNTLFGGSVIAVPGPCSLTDAVAAANLGTTVQNCVGKPGPNEIVFAVTGTIIAWRDARHDRRLLWRLSVLASGASRSAAATPNKS